MKINTSIIALALAATMGFASAPTMTFAQNTNTADPVTDPNLTEECIESAANQSLTTSSANGSTSNSNSSGDTASDCPPSTEVAPNAVLNNGAAVDTTVPATGGAAPAANTSTDASAAAAADPVTDPNRTEECIEVEANESLTSSDANGTQSNSNSSGDTASDCPPSTEVAPRAQ